MKIAVLGVVPPKAGRSASGPDATSALAPGPCPRPGAAYLPQPACVADATRAVTDAGHDIAAQVYALVIRALIKLPAGGLEWISADRDSRPATRTRQAGDAEIETRALAELGFHRNLVGRFREGL